MEGHLQPLITCPVCLDRYKAPKILPCQHTFCLKPCLQNLVDNGTLRCPQCRCTHKLARSGLVGLPNSLTIAALLELPSAKDIKAKEQVCQECYKENCTPSKCQHCDKSLCTSCSNSHIEHLLQALAVSVTQVRRKIPKISEMMTELEERQLKSLAIAGSVKAEINQTIERCVNELKKRQGVLLGQVDVFVESEARQLRVERDSLEMELATLSSYCEAAERKHQQFCSLTNTNSKIDGLDEAVRLTKQSQEHLRKINSISSDVDDTMQRSIKFHKERENTLLNTAADFGEISYSVPTRVSLSLGSDPTLNDLEIERAIHPAEYGRRADLISSYIPSFSSPFHGRRSPAISPAPSGGSGSPHGSTGSTNNSPRNLHNVPAPALSNRQPRRQRARWVRLDNRSPAEEISDRISSFLVPSSNFSSRRSPLLTSSLSNASYRDMSETYVSKGAVKSCFGLKGSDLGYLNWPRGVAVTPACTVAVTDSSNHRVQIFEATGEPILTFGSYGSDEGQFDCLAGIHVTAQGWIITADRYNHRIQIFDSMGRFIRMFGSEGSGEGELSYPWGISTDNMGFVYVCDKDNHRIQVFTLDGQFIRKFGRIGTHDGQFDGPQYLAVTQDNKVLVSDSGNHRVQVFDKYGRFIFKFGREGSAEGQLKYPRGIAVDGQGNIIVGDSGNNRVQIYRNNGTYLSGFGSWGPSPGQVKGIEGVALTNAGDIVLSDRENHRIQVF